MYILYMDENAIRSSISYISEERLEELKTTSFYPFVEPINYPKIYRDAYFSSARILFDDIMEAKIFAAQKRCEYLRFKIKKFNRYNGSYISPDKHPDYPTYNGELKKTKKWLKSKAAKYPEYMI